MRGKLHSSLAYVNGWNGKAWRGAYVHSAVVNNRINCKALFLFVLAVDDMIHQKTPNNRKEDMAGGNCPPFLFTIFTRLKLVFLAVRSIGPFIGQEFYFNIVFPLLSYILLLVCISHDSYLIRSFMSIC